MTLHDSGVRPHLLLAHLLLASIIVTNHGAPRLQSTPSAPLLTSRALSNELRPVGGQRAVSSGARRAVAFAPASSAALVRIGARSAAPPPPPRGGGGALRGAPGAAAAASGGRRASSPCAPLGVKRRSRALLGGAE